VSRVVVVGGSDQGRQTIDVLEAAGHHRIVGVIDPALAAGTPVSGHPVLDFDDADRQGADGFVVAVGDNWVRAEVVARTRAARPDWELVHAVHPAAVVARDAVLGAGATLMAGAVVSNGCVVGEGLLMGTNASIDHDNVVGAYASLAPGATTGGTVRIGDRTAVGLGASVIHGVTIGNHVVVGAGAVVVRDVPDRVVAFGVPAEVRRAREPGEPYLRRRGD
jgi:sugar O-acyltransferase (sialic acid O-acetyltransferase NeuD family)